MHGDNKRHGQALKQRAVVTLVRVARAAQYATDEGERLPDGRVVLTAPDTAALTHAISQLAQLPDGPAGQSKDGPTRAELVLRDILYPEH